METPPLPWCGLQGAGCTAQLALLVCTQDSPDWGSPCQDPLTLPWTPASLQPPPTPQAWPQEVRCLVGWGRLRGRSP